MYFELFFLLKLNRGEKERRVGDKRVNSTVLPLLPLLPRLVAQPAGGQLFWAVRAAGMGGEWAVPKHNVYMMKLEQTEQQQHKHCVIVPTVSSLVHLSPSMNHDEKS